MVRTRDLLVLVIAVVLSLFIGGLFFIGSTPAQERVSSTPPEVTLVSPRDTYDVSTSTKESIRDDREAFIQKVRDSYVPEDVPANEVDDTPFIFESDTPPPAVVATSVDMLPPVLAPEDTATTTLYGDSRF
jgi:hypothetical protein